jgi:hypothetical protein
MTPLSRQGDCEIERDSFSISIDHSGWFPHRARDWVAVEPYILDVGGVVVANTTHHDLDAHDARVYDGAERRLHEGDSHATKIAQRCLQIDDSCAQVGIGHGAPARIGVVF